MAIKHYRYNGPDYEPDRDNPRLDGQMFRIKSLMIDGEWRGLEDIAKITGDPPASVSAQLRHLRKPRFGGYFIEKKYMGSGLYHYRLIAPGQMQLAL